MGRWKSERRKSGGLEDRYKNDIYLIYNFFKRRKQRYTRSSIEVSKNFASEMFSFGFFMVHDSLGGCKNHVSELSGWKDLPNEFLKVIKFDIESWRNDSTFV